MSRHVTIRCDECGTAKTSVNHWFTVWTYYDAHLGSTVGQISSGIHFEDAEDSGIKHACGIAHAMTMLNRFASSGTLDRDVPKVDVMV